MPVSSLDVTFLFLISHVLMVKDNFVLHIGSSGVLYVQIFIE